MRKWMGKSVNVSLANYVDYLNVTDLQVKSHSLCVYESAGIVEESFILRSKVRIMLAEFDKNSVRFTGSQVCGCDFARVAVMF